MASKVAESLEGSISTDIKPFWRIRFRTKSMILRQISYLRSLPVFISEQLTKSLTHSLVPTLTQSLSGTSDQYHFCQMCKSKSKYCNYCYSSPRGMYYTIYYSTYYSDWYSNYYAKYYTDALKKIDGAAHPGLVCVDDDCSSTMAFKQKRAIKKCGYTNDYDLKSETIPAPIEPKIPAPEKPPKEEEKRRRKGRKATERASTTTGERVG